MVPQGKSEGVLVNWNDQDAKQIQQEDTKAPTHEDNTDAQSNLNDLLIAQDSVGTDDANDGASRESQLVGFPESGHVLEAEEPNGGELVNCLSANASPGTSADQKVHEYGVSRQMQGTSSSQEEDDGPQTSPNSLSPQDKGPDSNLIPGNIDLDGLDCDQLMAIATFLRMGFPAASVSDLLREQFSRFLWNSGAYIEILLLSLIGSASTYATSGVPETARVSERFPQKAPY